MTDDVILGVVDRKSGSSGKTVKQIKMRQFMKFCYNVRSLICFTFLLRVRFDFPKKLGLMENLLQTRSVKLTSRVI